MRQTAKASKMQGHKQDEDGAHVQGREGERKGTMKSVAGTEQTQGRQYADGDSCHLIRHSEDRVVRRRGSMNT